MCGGQIVELRLQTHSEIDVSSRDCCLCRPLIICMSRLSFPKNGDQVQLSSVFLAYQSKLQPSDQDGSVSV